MFPCKLRRKYDSNLKTIERDLDYTFPEQTTILFGEKDGKISTKKETANLLGVGVIRFPQTDENVNAISKELEWRSDIDNEIKKLLPKYFCQQIELYKIDCFLYVVDNEKVITFLAYDTENGVIYFAIVK